MVHKKIHERSFTLVETMAAMVILLLFVSEVLGVQGNAAFFTSHGRHLIRASYLGKRIMDQVEYNWNIRPFKDMDVEGREIPIEEIQNEENEAVYKYKLTIKDWKLPIFQLMQGSLGGGEDTEKSDAGGSGDMISGMLEKVLGKELFKVANVEIIWGDGARTDSESFTYLLTNKKKLEEVLVTLKPTYDKFAKGTSPTPNRAASKKRPDRPGAKPALPGEIPNPDGEQEPPEESYE